MGTRKSSVPGGPRKGKNGPPPYQPTGEQLDEASQLLGRTQYHSRAVKKLCERFPGLSVENAYRVLEAARERAIRELNGQGHDPMAAMYLYLVSVIADDDEPTASKLNACGHVIRMLGLDRLLKKMDAGGVEAYLARLAGVQAARPGVAESVETVTDPELTQGE